MEANAAKESRIPREQLPEGDTRQAELMIKSNTQEWKRPVQPAARPGVQL